MSNYRKRHNRSNNYISLICIIAGIVFITFIVAFQVKSIDNNAENTTNEGEVTAKSDNVSGESSGKDIINHTKDSTDNKDGENQNDNTEEAQEVISVTKNKVKTDEFTVPEYIYGLVSTKQSLGYGSHTQRDEYNRPVIIENFENKYGEKYNAVFIGEEEKVIYLTFTMGYEYFNDGVPNTERILKILEEKNVKAAFFVDGGYAEHYPDMCKKIVESGNVLGCHGYEHPSTGVALYPVEKQVEDAKKIYSLLYGITGKEPYLYRFGSGIWSEQALALLYEMGFKNVFYSFTYYDYNVDEQQEPAEALQKLIENLHYGEIIYLHTVSNTNVQILGQFIDEAKSRGYEFKLIQ